MSKHTPPPTPEAAKMRKYIAYTHKNRLNLRPEAGAARPRASRCENDMKSTLLIYVDIKKP